MVILMKNNYLIKMKNLFINLYVISFFLFSFVISAQDLLYVVPGKEKVVPSSTLQVELSYSPVVKLTSPAVVNVFTSRTISRRGSSFFDQMFGMRRAPQERTESSLGSGVIVRGTGVIVTNAHVVNGAEELKIVLNDRREFEAVVLAQDEDIDIAVLKIDVGEEILPSLAIQKDNTTEIGDIVLAIGNPFGVGQTVTSGIISALGRTNVTDTSSFIQTDAAVNPGNSGGALVNINGDLIGINTAISSQTGNYIGYSFAVPSNIARKVVEDIMEFGNVQNGILGVIGGELNSNDFAKWGRDCNMNNEGINNKEGSFNIDQCYKYMLEHKMAWNSCSQMTFSIIESSSSLNGCTLSDKIKDVIQKAEACDANNATFQQLALDKLNDLIYLIEELNKLIANNNDNDKFFIRLSDLVNRQINNNTNEIKRINM